MPDDNSPLSSPAEEHPIRTDRRDAPGRVRAMTEHASQDISQDVSQGTAQPDAVRLPDDKSASEYTSEYTSECVSDTASECASLSDESDMLSAMALLTECCGPDAECAGDAGDFRDDAGYTEESFGEESHTFESGYESEEPYGTLDESSYSQSLAGEGSRLSGEILHHWPNRFPGTGQTPSPPIYSYNRYLYGDRFHSSRSAYDSESSLYNNSSESFLNDETASSTVSSFYFVAPPPRLAAAGSSPDGLPGSDGAGGAAGLRHVRPQVHYSEAFRRVSSEDVSSGSSDLEILESVTPIADDLRILSSHNVELRPPPALHTYEIIRATRRQLLRSRDRDNSGDGAIEEVAASGTAADIIASFNFHSLSRRDRHRSSLSLAVWRARYRTLNCIYRSAGLDPSYDDDDYVDVTESFICMPQIDRLEEHLNQFRATLGPRCPYQGVPRSGLITRELAQQMASLVRRAVKARGQELDALLGEMVGLGTWLTRKELVLLRESTVDYLIDQEYPDPDSANLLTCVFDLTHGRYSLSFIPRRVYRTVKFSNLVETAATSCSICYDDYRQSSSVIVLDCVHIFHSRCLKTWLREARCCPICRAELAGEPL